MPYKPDSTYVTKLLNQLKDELRGFHTRISETEDVRYLEDEIALSDEDKITGIEIRIGASAELIENVKSAILNTPAVIKVDPRVERNGAAENAAKREDFWTRYLQKRMDGEAPVIREFADSLIGLGSAFLKAAQVDYPLELHKKLPNESAKDHLERVKGLKRLHGPPFEVINIHPMALYPRRGRGNRLEEMLEHSYKSKPYIYRHYGIDNDKALKEMSSPFDMKMLDKDVYDVVLATRGQPDMDIKPLPMGTSTSNLSLVTEYWSPDVHQVYIDRRLIHEEENPKLVYIMALARTTSSTDMDKTGFGVAELMRHNEPTVNRMLTRMAEANELLVKQRLTVELPEGDTINETMPNPDQDQGGQVPRTFRFKSDVAEALPAGANVVNPFQGVENVYQSMPMIQMIMSVMGQHGVSPLFKGIPPGAIGSGYRDNSLYLMAKAQLQYVIDAYANAQTRLFRQLELWLADMDETIYIDELELSPSDITNWPAELTVKVIPEIPQNMIAEGTFWDRMHANGHIPRRLVRERGWNEQDTASVEREVRLERLFDALEPQLLMDVLASTVGMQPQSPGEPSPGAPPGMNGAGPQEQRPGAGRDMGRAIGGMSRAGQPREPSVQPGATPGQENLA